MNLRDLKLERFPFLKEGIALALFFTVISLAFNILFYSPSKKETKGLKGDVEKLDGSIVNYQAAAAVSGKESERLQEMMKTYEEMEARLLSSKEQIPPAKEVSNILKDLSSPPPGMTLVAMQASPFEDKGEYLRLPLVFQVRGDFSSLGAYLTGLENSGRLIGVDNLNMAKDKEDKAGLSVRMELSVYIMKEVAI